MEKKLIEEISRTHKLMGVKTVNRIEESNNTNKEILLETTIKPHLNFPNARAFDDFKLDGRFKGIPNLKGMDWDDVNVKFIQLPTSVSGLVSHIKNYKPLWVAGLMKKYPSLSQVDAEKYISKSLSAAEKIENGTIKHTSLYQKMGDGTLGYEVFPKEGGLRSMILDAYKKKYESTGQWQKFVDEVKAYKKSDANKIVNDVKTIDSEQKLDTKIKEKTKNKFTPEDVKTKWKNAGGDESKLEIALDRNWTPGKQVPADLKVKSSTPTPPKPNVQSPAGVVQGSGFISPLTGKEMSWEEAAEAFGSNRTASDNILFYQAFFQLSMQEQI